jgi:predicted hotdog family 3-hydroxylacyl-ACP dehydratase
VEQTREMALDAWIPHRGAMQLLDRIVHVDAENAVAELRVPADGLFNQDGQVPAWIGIEYMAQTISAWAAGRHHQRGGEGAKLGLLLGSRRYTAHRGAFPAGATLRVSTHCEIIGDNGLGMFDCRIEMDGEEVAVAKVSVFEPDDAFAFLKPGAAQ